MPEKLGGSYIGYSNYSIHQQADWSSE
ncbi:uncharacterized protein G2W53_004857 [Senna tora]|uniref:Uncharacterized protein n=1 Tax=Senna tora TaxID=362788 RepID=A0A834XCJ3_9FABA|nr:uncharacterized protein G2W53_004857 [Senna tora]